MTGSGKAVFLSYASQDAAPARQVCDALREAGIEVWFDQNELRGGDSWDQKIRQQIRDCALFLPIISQNTQARPEGYFRLEWRLADQRTHLMGRNKSFLVPICIDAIPERGADVPDSFLAVQWTRLPDGQPSPEFVARIKGLLHEQASVAVAPIQVRRTEMHPSRRHPWWIGAGLVAVIALAAAAYHFSIRPHRELQPALPAPAPAPAPTAARASEKSLAVLPFLDMSEKHDQEYFSDGLAEELIDQLAKTPGLQVIARTSSFSFKGKPDDIPTIARKLGVANVLEGSVRKSGNRLRVSAQLVRADNGYPLWSESYDREFKDIFAVQDDIAAAVVAALKVSLAADTVLPTTGTGNAEAYGLYLQGRAIGTGATDLSGALRAIDYLQRAVAADPAYAAAWAGLSVAQHRRADFAPHDQQAGIAKQELEAAQRALRLDPNLSEAHSALAIYLFHHADIGGAESHINKALELDPRNGQALSQAGVLALARGRFGRASAYFQRAIDNDPVNPQRYQYLAFMLYCEGKYPEALAAIRRMEDLAPAAAARDTLKSAVLLAQGDAAAALAANDRVSDEKSRMGNTRVAILDALGRKAEADAVLAQMAKAGADNAYDIACVYAGRGQVDQAFMWLGRVPEDQSIQLTYLRVDPDLKGIRADPRFKILLKKVNLPE